MNLLDHIKAIFSPDGGIVKLGGRYTKEQYDYALLVGQSLLNKDSNLSCLEAETGIGKTIGYITPILLQIAINHKNGINTNSFVVSTFTRQLQKQVADKDMAFAKKLVKWAGFEYEALSAYRMGRNAFFSIERTRNHALKLIASQPHREPEIQEFFKYVSDSAATGSGLWIDYIEEHGVFPAGIKYQDICLLAEQKVDNEAYLHHIEKAKYADVLITNHISLLLADSTGLAERPISAIVLDEAHKVSEIMFELSHFGLNLQETKRLIGKLADELGLANIKKEMLLIQEIEDFLKKHPNFNTWKYVAEINEPEVYKQVSKKISSLNKGLKAHISSYKNLLDRDQYTVADIEFMNNLEEMSSTLSNWNHSPKNPFQMSAISVSDVHKSIKFNSMNVFGNRLFANRMSKLTNNIIFTSGTISDQTITLGFNSFKRDLGYSKTEINYSCSLSPKIYGNMNFVICPNHIPKPLLKDEDGIIDFHPLWLKNAVKMINDARKTGQKILVLTVSHSESLTIGKALGNKNIIVHQSDTALSQCVHNFKNGTEDILITSAGWEGLNLRSKDGGQLIHHLVITRLPYVPPNETHDFLLKCYIKQNNLNSYQELGISWVEQNKRMIPTLIQGFGRGIRSPKDDVLVWIADPRMPRARTKTNQQLLLNAVPKRFRENYLNARVFGEAQKNMVFI